MTILAFGTHIGFHMVGRCACLVVSHVAVHALHTQGLEPQLGGGLVAALTIGHQVWSQKGETSLAMDIRNVVHDPGVGGVAPVTLVTDGLLVQVRMATVTFRFSL